MTRKNIYRRCDKECPNYQRLETSEYAMCFLHGNASKVNENDPCKYRLFYPLEEKTRDKFVLKNFSLYPASYRSLILWDEK